MSTIYVENSWWSLKFWILCKLFSWSKFGAKGSLIKNRQRSLILYNIILISTYLTPKNDLYVVCLPLWQYNCVRYYFIRLEPLLPLVLGNEFWLSGGTRKTCFLWLLLFILELVILKQHWKKKGFYDDNDDVLLLLFGQLIYHVPGSNRRTGKYIFIEGETERRKRTSLVYYTMIHIIIIII